MGFREFNFIDVVSSCDLLNAIYVLFDGAYISNDRIADAVNVILTLQNSDGGWASYENKRAGEWLESINPSEVFCTSLPDGLLLVGKY